MVEVARPPAYARFGGSHYIRDRRRQQQDSKAFDSLILAPVDLGVIAVGEFSDSITMPSNGQLAVRAVSALPSQAILLQKNEIDFFTHPALEEDSFFKGKFAYVNEQIRVVANEEGLFQICVVDAIGRLFPIAYGEVGEAALQGEARFSAAGDMVASGTQALSNVAEFSGFGNLSAQGQFIPASPGAVYDEEANFSASGEMQAQGFKQTPAQASFEATGTMGASNDLVLGDVATFSASGSMSADHTLSMNAQSAFTATGTMVADSEVDVTYPFIDGTYQGYQAGDVTSVEITMPTGISNGDFLVVYVNSAAAATIDTAESGTGWELSSTISPTSMVTRCFSKIANGDDVLTLNAGSNNGMSYVVHKIKNATNLLSATATSGNNRPNPPSLNAKTGATQYFPNYEHLWMAIAGASEIGSMQNTTGAPDNMDNLIIQAPSISGLSRGLILASINKESGINTFDPTVFPGTSNPTAWGAITQAIYKAAPSPIQFIGQVSGTGTGSSLTMPSHQAGDLLVAWSYRVGSSTEPSLPSGWTNINFGGGTSSSNAARAAFRVADDSSTPAPTFSNGGFTIILVYRNARIATVNSNLSAAGSSTGIPYLALTNNVADLTSWQLIFGAHRAGDGNIDTPPTGFTLRGSLKSTSQIAAFDSNGGRKSVSAETVAIGATSNNTARCTIELYGYWG